MVESQVGQIMERAGIAFFWGGGIQTDKQAHRGWRDRGRGATWPRIPHA